jgi:hypothetical protein
VNKCNKQGISGTGVWGDRVDQSAEGHQSIETHTSDQARWQPTITDSEQADRLEHRRSRDVSSVDSRGRDQRPQLFMIDSAEKRDTILRPSLSLQPDRSNPCSVRPTRLSILRCCNEVLRIGRSSLEAHFVTPNIMSPRPFQTRSMV